MKLSSKVKIISLFFLVLIVIIFNIIMLLNQNEVLFHDNASFQDFNVRKTEPFNITKKSVVELKFDCDISDGIINVSILDSNKEVIISYNEMKYFDEIKKTLEPGTYYYEIQADHAKGRFEYKGVIKRHVK